MTIDELRHLNKKFQDKAAAIPEMLPMSDLIEYSSVLIRRSVRLERVFHKLLAAKEEFQVTSAMSAAEHEMDEIIYLLDRLDNANRKKNYQPITDFVKYGFELLSFYSICCDQVLEEKIKETDFE